MADGDSRQAEHGGQDACRKLAFGGQVERNGPSAFRERRYEQN